MKAKILASNATSLVLSRANARANDIHNKRRQSGAKARVSRRQMYAMRYRMFINGWSIEKVAVFYRVDREYVRRAVYNYGTMSGVIPQKGLLPEDFERVKTG